MDPRESTARTFATRVVEGRFADAADLLTDDGRSAVVDSFPDFLTAAGTDAEAALESYWWGLRGQYGEPVAVDELTVGDDTATVTFGFENGTEAATLALADEGVSDFGFSPAYERPAYADEDAIVEREVTVDAGDVALDGLLAVPREGTPAPGVVLVHGDGVHDPDGTVGNTKLMRDLAWGLASGGVASLRYENRLAAHDVAEDALTLDGVVTDDAVAAVDRLAESDDVRADSLFVVGHSLGGTCAPRVADRHGGLAGVVNLDGSPDQILPPDHADVIRYEYAIDGDLDEEQSARLADDRDTLRRIAAGEFDDDETLMGRPGRWHRSLLDYDPVSTACDLDVPTFVLTAFGADEETQPELAAFVRSAHETWLDADLPAGSRVERYTNVDHYLQSITPPASPPVLYFGGTVAEKCVDDVSEWLRDVGTR
jgi:hypothetical protein